jgi:hypothetical protein
MRDKVFILVFAVAETAHFARVAFVLNDGHVGYDLIDAFFSEQVGLLGLHLQNGPLLFCGQDHGVLGEDIEGILQLFHLLGGCGILGVEALDEGEQSLRVLLLPDHDVGVVVPREYQLVISNGQFVDENAQDLNLQLILGLLGGEVETAQDEGRGRIDFMSLELLAGEPEAGEDEGLRPEQ